MYNWRLILAGCLLIILLVLLLPSPFCEASL